MKILIVDDSISMREKLKEYLRLFGHTEMAKDGQGAYEKIESALLNYEPYDVIFTDINMPRMSGSELIMKVRNFEDRINYGYCHKFVVVSICSYEDLDIGEDFMEKPITFKEIFTKMSLMGYSVNMN